MSFLDDDSTAVATRPHIDLGQSEVYEPPATRDEGGAELAQLSRLARDAGPRDTEAMTAEARRVGYQLGQILDERGEGTAAYYRWHAGGSVIEGPTVGMMDALGHLYGRLVYSVRIVSERGQRVTLRGRVVDLVNLVAHERDYAAALRAPPAKFADRVDEAERWRVMQLQAAESKAIRGVLEHVVPAHLVEAAMSAARDGAAKARLRGASLPEAVGKTVEALTSIRPAIDIVLVERWVGRQREEWTAVDLGEIRGLYRRWKDGLLTPDGLRAEAVEREQQRGGATVRKADDADADRLSGLGLGNPTTSSGGTGGLASGETSSSTVETKRTNVGEDLDALIRALEQAGGPVTVDLARERFKTIASVGRLTSARWDPIVALGLQMGKIIVENDRIRLPKPEAKPNPIAAAVVVEVSAMTLGDLQEQCRWMLAELSDDQARDALRTAAIPAIDGATAPALANLLTILRARAAGGAA
jgi:hypothetical protein